MSEKAARTEKPQGTGQGTVEPQGSTSQEPQGTSEKPQQPEKSDVDWQAEARKWEQRAKKDAKATAELRDQVKRLIDPDEAQQQVKSVEDQVQAVTLERDQALTEAMRWRIGVKAGLDAADIDDLLAVLPGEDEDMLTARAARIAERIQRAPKVGTPSAKVGAGENGDTPSRSLEDEITEAQRNGDTRRVIALNNQKLAAAAAAT